MAKGKGKNLNQQDKNHIEREILNAGNKKIKKWDRKGTLNDWRNQGIPVDRALAQRARTQ